MRRAELTGAGQPQTLRQESSVSTLTGTPTVSKLWTSSIGMATRQLLFLSFSIVLGVAESQLIKCLQAFAQCASVCKSDVPNQTKDNETNSANRMHAILLRNKFKSEREFRTE